MVLVGVLFVALLQGAAGSPWLVSFEEASEAVGIDFQAAGEMHDPAHIDLQWPAFPEIAGVGACWADFDGDGFEDLYIANQRYNDGNPYAAGFNDLFDPTNRLYLNNGDGTFTDRTISAGVESRSFDYGCSAVDHDGDGHVDILITGWGHIKLYRNNGDGTFTDLTQAAGLDISTLCLPHDCWTSCSAWADYNGNGWLDLFVCTFVESHMADSGRGPGGKLAQFNFLFRNNGDGTFTEVAHEAGVAGIAADAQGSKSWGAVWFDANLNGWSDLYVANDQTPNEFYWNNGDGTFTRDDDAGLYDQRAGMGVAVGDATGSGKPDLYFTHYAGQHNGFYTNRGDGTFLDRSGEDGLAADFALVGWGTHFVDLDRSGHMDIVAVNGHTIMFNPAYGQKTLVFRQEPQGDGTTKWVDVSDVSGPGVLEQRVSRGSAVADFDLDGNVDLVVLNNANQSLEFLRGSGNTNQWLYVQPVQDGANHQAIGARVVVEAGGREQVREIRAGSSFLSQDSLLADFGLGAAQSVDRVTVYWPGGGETVVEGLDVDRVVRIDRETGGYETDTLSPLTTAMVQGLAGKGDWYRSGLAVSLVAEDRAVGPASGVAWTQVQDEEGSWQEYAGQVFEFPAEEGDHVLSFRSMDHAGNVEPVRTQPFRIDLTPPETEHEVVGVAGSNGWWLDAELHLSAHDALSGVDRMQYRLDDGPWLDHAGPIGFAEGTHLVHYTAWDRAGNQAPVVAVEVRVDATPPEVALLRPTPGSVYHGNSSVTDGGVGPAILLTTPEPVGGGSFAVEWEAFDATSGLDRVDLFLNGEAVATFFAGGPSYSWLWNTTGQPAGTYLLHVVVQDGAGNVAADDRFVVLAPATPGGVMATLGYGPSLYPVWAWP